MRYEREVSLGGYTAKIVKESGRNSIPLLLFNSAEHSQEYLQEALVECEWEQDLSMFNIGVPIWTKPLTTVTSNQLYKEAEKLLGELYYHNRLIILDEYRKKGIEARII